ncbi:MAG: hypothetical protein OXH69_24825 [Acidobacteria bacterium]|nr:hypothetical protein [Acidobacteriota bacterium]
MAQRSRRPAAIGGALAALALLAGSPAPASEAPGGSATQDDGIVAQLIEYVGAQQALAADDADRARAALERLIAVADDVTRPLVQAVARADDIETMRQRFKPLSEFLAALDLPRGYARAYCPMYDGGSNWVQLDGPVRNPYYGSTMLTCGVVDAAPGAHMDHTPRHGGTVFMAPDGFHHIEGAYPEPGVFRIYATDNYREPVDVTLWMGRAVLEEEYDAATDEFLEVTAFAMLPAPGGAYLEAEVGDVAVPAEIIAKLQFADDFPEERFDFIFAGFSGDAPRETLTLDRPNVPAALPLAERIRPRIPERTSDIVGGIEARDREIVDLVTRGAFTEIFIPALQAKELALALHDRAEALPARARDDVRIAVRSLVRAAWLLDWYGDLGNKQQVDDAYGVFGSAVSQISRVYGEAAAP